MMLLEDEDGAPFPEEVQQAFKQAAFNLWDQGYRSGWSNAMRWMSDEPDLQKTPNPYEEHDG